MEILHLLVAVELVLRVAVLVQPHLMVASGRELLKIYGKLLPQHFSKSSESNAPIDRILTNDYILPYVRS